MGRALGYASVCVVGKETGAAGAVGGVVLLDEDFVVLSVFVGVCSLGTGCNSVGGRCLLFQIVNEGVYGFLGDVLHDDNVVEVATEAFVVTTCQEVLVDDVL